jgi:hypothetical protein
MDLKIRLMAKYELNYGTNYKLHILLCGFSIIQFRTN